MDVEFTDDEIREELARLGYKDVPDDKLVEFKKDLMRLIHSERSKSNSLNSSADELKYEEGALGMAKTGTQHAGGNFTNHGNQWLRSNYKENWDYRGERKAPAITRSMTDIRSKPQDSSAYTSNEMHSRLGRNDNHCCDFRDDVSETESEKRFIKRKTSRKASNGGRVVDESFNDGYSETAGIYEIYEKIKKLAMRDCECGKTRLTSADIQPPYRINGVNKNPSVILKQGEPPHTRNLVRTCPFKRHQMYQRMWKAQPAIGDDGRNKVRREVHAKMLQKDEIKAFHKVFVPNRYVAPTDKPRYELRWAVRRANEKFEMPPHGFYHEV